MLDKTVNFFNQGKYIETSAFSTDVSFTEVVEIYLKYKGFDKVIIRQWKDQKEIKSHTITFAI